MSQELINLLPIGSVVLLKEANKRIMIVGRMQRKKGEDKVWDYSACFYPEGVLDPTQMFLFDHEQIGTVFFLGFQDREGLELQKKLTEKYEEIKGNNPEQ